MPTIIDVVSSDSSSDKSSIIDGSESTDDSIMEICAVSIVLLEREVNFHRLQLAWDHHATILKHEKQFDVKYRMSYESFMRLTKLLEPRLAQSNCKSFNSCGQAAICPHHILGLTIFWLNGGIYNDIRDTGNFSAPTFFRLLKKGLYTERSF
jgi:hypothetical protein